MKAAVRSAAARSSSTVAQPIPAMGSPTSHGSRAPASARTWSGGGEEAGLAHQCRSRSGAASPTRAKPRRAYRRCAASLSTSTARWTTSWPGLERVARREQRRQGAEAAATEPRPRPDRREVAAVAGPRRAGRWPRVRRRRRPGPSRSRAARRRRGRRARARRAGSRRPRTRPRARARPRPPSSAAPASRGGPR